MKDISPFVSFMKFEPYTAGSGIPQTNAEVMGSADMPWYRVLPVKFIQGVLVAFGGLSMGREGPSVQLGAVSGKAVSKFLILAVHYKETMSLYVPVEIAEVAVEYLEICQQN